jgi:choice-of-anchor B domain-containing protein
MGLMLAASAGIALGQQTSNEDFSKLMFDAPPYKGGGVVGDPRGPNEVADDGFSAGNTTLLSWLALDDFPGDHSRGNDCWGYTSPSGREYAIMGLERGFGFVDITDPVNPVILEVIGGARSVWRDVKVIGEYAYGVNEDGNGIQVMDLRQIDQGVVRHVRDRRQNGHSRTHNIAANPDSGYLYLCGGNIGNGGLVAFNTNDPEWPTIDGAWTGNYIHDAQIVTYTEGPYAGREIAYGFTGNWMRVIDVTNKNNMTLLAQVTYPGARYCHQGWLSGDRQYVYADDEFDEVRGQDTTATRIFDVSDPGNPVYLGIGSSGQPASDHNQYWHNGNLYQANYRSGLQVLDASDPVNPRRIAWFDTHPETDNSGFAGSWSCFPFFESGSILISDMQRGLFVVRLGEPCSADFNSDGEVNTLDVTAFLNAWSSGDSGADMNGDGDVNTLDVTEFLNAWVAGCA